jgi:hypothetical protein
MLLESSNEEDEMGVACVTHERVESACVAWENLKEGDHIRSKTVTENIRRRRKENFKMNLKERGWEGVE